MSENSNNGIKRIAGLTAAMVWIGLFLAVFEARAETNNPDGNIGRPVFGLTANYASATGRENFWVKDFQDVSGRMAIPLSPNATGAIFGNWHKQDSVRYAFGLQTRLYLFDSKDRSQSNPDGILRRLVTELEIGLRTSSDPDQEPKAIGAIKILYPYSTQLTLQADYRYYQSIQVQDVESFAVGLTYFSGPAVVDSFLVNPDGPVGDPVLTLRGGGSTYGAFGELTIGCPLNRQLTVSFTARAEFVNRPYDHALIAGLGFTWFAP